MNWVWPWLLIGWSSIALGQTTPIRGATGGGYGQFSWGTSLETIERLTPRMRLNNGTATAQEVRQLLAQLAKSSRSKATPDLKQLAILDSDWATAGARELSFFAVDWRARVPMTYSGPNRELSIKR